MSTQPISIPRQAGIYVRRSREAQGLTRAQLAIAAGVSERLLASLELGDATGIRLDKLLAVFDALGLQLLAQGEAIAPGKAQAPAVTQRSATLKTSHVPAPPVKTDGSHVNYLNNNSHRSLLREVAGEMGISLSEET